MSSRASTATVWAAVSGMARLRGTLPEATLPEERWGLEVRVAGTAMEATPLGAGAWPATERRKRPGHAHMGETWGRVKDSRPIKHVGADTPKIEYRRHPGLDWAKGSTPSPR